jgi:hypothetical protein
MTTFSLASVLVRSAVSMNAGTCVLNLSTFSAFLPVGV